MSLSPLFKSLTKLSGYAVCLLLPVLAVAQSPERPVFDSFSYANDPLFTPRLVRSRIVLPTKSAVAAPVRMSARDQRDLGLAIDKALSQILKLTVDYTELLKLVDTLRAESQAKKSSWSVFSGRSDESFGGPVPEPVGNMAALEAELDKSRKQVSVLETQLAATQERLNAAQANFEGENAARLMTEQRLADAREQLATAPTSSAAEAAASESASDRVLAVPVREWIIAGLEFELGSADIKQGTEANLSALLTYMQQKPKIQIQVDGYTDSIGSIAENLKLSKERAQAVADYLIKRGIDAHRIRVVGYGEGRPIASNMYQAGRAQNRRVAIIFFGVE